MARRFQYRLRTMFIITAVVAVVCGWLASKVEKKRRELKAAEVVSQFGAVRYDYETDENGDYVDNSEPHGPKWLRNLLGENYFSEVVGVSMIPTDDKAIAGAADALQTLPHLKQLSICAPGLTDISMPKLGKLTQLESLDIQAISHVTDAGLQNLRGLANLRHLELDRSVSPAAIEELRKALPNCEIN
jgi:hypothetical protein